MSNYYGSDWKCPKCGTLNNMGNFCAECGEPKPAPLVAPMYQQQQAPLYQEPVIPMEEELVKPNNKGANILCIISLLCMYLVPIINFVIFAIVDMIEGHESEVTDTVFLIGFGLGTIAVIAAYILMIIARVRYKKSTFAEVLMWIYIVQTVIAVILAVITIVACFGMLYQCSRGMV
ncbi:MAG: hypothetical protein MJ103_09155 [Saccharofermentans sp.]|nr:hypothetical protein [Saccharofermentans sp.]